VEPETVKVNSEFCEVIRFLLWFTCHFHSVA